MVVKEHFSFCPVVSIPIPDSRILDRSRSRAEASLMLTPCSWKAVRKQLLGIMTGNFFLQIRRMLRFSDQSDFPPVTYFDQIRAGNRVHFTNKKGLDLLSKPFLLLVVAGTGFEPVTFGL
jgi:hypothetical protein